MGEDIHQRIYVKSKKTGKYINAHELCAWDSERSSVFKCIVPDRNYDAFALFGSMRSSYNELQYSNYGMPDFLKNTEFDQYCINLNFYGFIWFKLPDLKKAVQEYIDNIKNPLKFLDETSAEYADWKKNIDNVTSGLMDIDVFLRKYNEWLDRHRNILDSLIDIRSKIEIYDYLKDESRYAELIDVNETVFLFFFDN